MERGGVRRMERGSLWALLLRCARTLLGDEHPRRAFNHCQMGRVDLLRHLLVACKVHHTNQISFKALQFVCTRFKTFAILKYRALKLSWSECAN